MYFCDAFNIPVVTLTNVKEYAADMQEEKIDFSGSCRFDIMHLQVLMFRVLT